MERNSTDSAAASPGRPANLVQVARTKLLRSISFMLVGMGVLMIGVYAFWFSTAKSNIKGALDEVVQESEKQGKTIDPAELRKAESDLVWTQQWTAAVFVALGIVYVVLGILVFRWPAPITILALVLYLGSLALIGIFDPAQMSVGWPVKVVIVVGLWKAITAARSYDRLAIAGANS